MKKLLISLIFVSFITKTDEKKITAAELAIYEEMTPEEQACYEKKDNDPCYVGKKGTMALRAGTCKNNTCETYVVPIFPEQEQ